jgi:hypothetical protein
LAREQEKKKERTEAPTKDLLHSKMQNAQWGSSNKRKPQTLDLNPSSVAQSKSCKEMGKKPGRTPSSAATIANARYYNSFVG